MSKGSNPTNVTTTTSQEPSDFISPYITQGMNAAQDLFESGTPSYYPNQTYADFAPETIAAQDMIIQNVAQGSPLLGQAQGEVSNILSGNYLSPTSNPYTQGLYNQMAGDVTAGVQSQFSKAGRLGSAANQEVLASELGQLANQVYGDQYNQAQNQMMNAIQLAPGLEQANYNDIAALAGVGQQNEAMQMAEIQDAINAFDFQQQQPFYTLNQYLGQMGSNVPTTTYNTQPVFQNAGAGILGGAMQGYNLGQNFGMGGLGAIGGGLLGGFA
tara:strand:+ start:171 stop:983 length:813 start_codon:yes stop_codon:yes gene_type:complete